MAQPHPPISAFRRRRGKTGGASYQHRPIQRDSQAWSRWQGEKSIDRPFERRPSEASPERTILGRFGERQLLDEKIRQARRQMQRRRRCDRAAFVMRRDRRIVWFGERGHAAQLGERIQSQTRPQHTDNLIAQQLLQRAPPMDTAPRSQPELLFQKRFYAAPRDSKCDRPRRTRAGGSVRAPPPGWTNLPDSAVPRRRGRNRPLVRLPRAGFRARCTRRMDKGLALISRHDRGRWHKERAMSRFSGAFHCGD